VVRLLCLEDDLRAGGKGIGNVQPGRHGARTLVRIMRGLKPTLLRAVVLGHDTA
jgi:hypothetical protein